MTAAARRGTSGSGPGNQAGSRPPGTRPASTRPATEASAAATAPSAATVIVPGAASLAVRQPLSGSRRQARVIAANPAAFYLELPPPAAEPRVVVIAAAGAPRLPNAVAVMGTEELDRHIPGAMTGEAWIGRGTAQAGALSVRVLRWWDPSPVLGPLSRVRLEQGAAALQRACAAAGLAPSLVGHDGPAELAACCAEGDLAGAVEASDLIVGLGPGLAPGGDNMISGLLLALRLLGGAIPGGTRAVWLADWLGAAVTADAAIRTTALGGTLLHCAAHGQAAAEVSAVLHGLAGQEPLAPAARTLLATGQTAGADLAWGLVAGCRAALALTHTGR